MSISIRTVLLLGSFGAGSTLGACGGYVNLGDPSMAGAGGEDNGAGGAKAPGSGGTGGTGSGAAPATGGAGGETVEAGTGGGTDAGAGGDEPAKGGGAGSGGSAQAGTGGIPADAGAGGSAVSEVPPLGPRSGSFRMLVYSRTMGFRHSSIPDGQKMLEAIASEQGFEVTLTETNEEITPEGLAKYEIVFFLNTTGDIFTDTEQAAFEAWMTTRNGAFAGVHAATDTELNWPFYKEVTGQYYDLHDVADTPDEVLLEDAAADFPGMAGLPNPWQRPEEWFRFNSHAVWSQKPGFTILARRASNNHPVSWTREFANFRSFYTSIGHQSWVYDDELVKAHIAGGIMWTVRREHLFQE